MFGYSLCAAIRNTGGHFIAIIKADSHTYYYFNDTDPTGCSIHGGLVNVDFAIYTLKV